MGVPEPADPVMDREEADRALARLGAEHEAVESSLLALQDHAGRRLLEGTELTGATRGRWAEAEERVTALWAHFEAFTALLQQARELRARRRWPTPAELAELTELLTGPSVALPAHRDERDGEGERPAAAEQPGGGERLRPDELVERMNGWYARALDVIVAADAVWSALPARMDLLSAELRRTRSLAHSVGVRPGEHPAGDDLERITAGLTALRAEVVSDPLAFWTPAASASSAPGGGRPDTSRYDREARALDDVRREIEAVLDVRQDAERRLAVLRDVLSRADRTLTEARQARGEVLAKIAASEVPAVSGPPTALHEQLAAAADYRRRAQWHRLSPLLDRLEERAEDELVRARESLTAVTAPLAVRAELRGRLDAYRSRVTRHGMAEDPLLVERYDAARRILWSAPCDLRAAEYAVRRYRQAAMEVLVPRQADAEHRTGAEARTDARPGAEPPRAAAVEREDHGAGA
ncbi:hypothetical protein AB0C51_22960 [Streptomyces pathocidini]|uniref:hypothetical protein n=1 Tax=Streptomyces pathocidini TaxID=1650571 RepID=UPI0034015C96